MSSTNRGDTERQRDDYYVTPKWCVREFLRSWNFFKNVPHDPLIVDPCAGGDTVNGMTYPEVIKEWGYNTVSMDIRPDSPAEFPMTNFLTADVGGIDADLLITNPPFNLAIEMIPKAFTVVKTGGWVVMLLRINFLGAQARGAFWQEFMPHSIYVHSKRPGFYPDNWRELYPELKTKSTDSTEYAHFVWQVGNYPKFSQTRVIEHVEGVSDAPGPDA